MKLSVDSMFLKTLLKYCFWGAVLFVAFFAMIWLLNLVLPFNVYPLVFEAILALVFLLIAVLLVCVSCKITKRNTIESVKHKFHEIFDLSCEEISIIDADTLTFVDLNKNFLENTQFSKEELLGQTIDKANPKCDIQNIKEFINPLITGEKASLECETIRLRKDGTTYSVKTTLKYLKEPDFLIAFSKDTTNAQSIEELKERFISLINHKIRTKLTSISGALKIITNGLVGEIPLRMTEMIKMAHENSQELSNEIDKILDIDNYLKEL